MKLHRIWAVVMRHVYLFPKSFDRITDVFFWPTAEILLWGLAGKWLANQPEDAPLLAALLAGISFWRVVWYANYEFGCNLLEECWNRNMANLYSSPLTKLEWLSANLLLGVMKLVAVLLLCLTMVWLLYEINLFTIGWMWVPFFVSLTMAGWWIGCIASGLILLWGIRAQALAWVLAFVIAPISAVYYPVAMLPSLLQPLAYALPTTYIFEGMRALLLAESRNFNLLLIVSLVLNALYLALGLWFFNFMFERKRNRGFDDLE